MRIARRTRARIARAPRTPIARVLRERAAATAAAAFTAAVALAGAASPAAAQESVWMEAAVGGGATVPIGDLTGRRLSFGTRLQSSAVAVAGLSLWLPSGFGLALEGLYTRADVATTAGEEGFAAAGGLGAADYRAGIAELRYRYRYAGAESLVQPYWGLGAGVRRLEFEPIARPDLRDATDPVISLSVGSVVRISDRFGVRVELRDVRGRYDSGLSDETETQNDLVFSVGAVGRIF